MWTTRENETEQLRKKLEDYYGTAMCSGFPMAMMELEEVRRASDEEIIQMAQRLGKI